MFVTKFKGVLAVGLAYGGIGAGMTWQTQAAQQPKAKEEQPAAKRDQKESEEKHPTGKEEKLRVLIDKVLAAHGGEDKLNKLQFTMTVRQDKTTIEYFVQPPDHFRTERQQTGEATKQIGILLQHGTKRWTKHPSGEATMQPEALGAISRTTVEYELDQAKFFGPRQVVRLKDADHRVGLLDEVTMDGRAAVGVELIKAVPIKMSWRMFFDKETNLLVRQENVLWSTSVSYSDYKKLDRLPIAQKEKHTEKDGSVWEVKVTDFRAVDELDAKLFERP